jgi:hypothetical protein
MKQKSSKLRNLERNRYSILTDNLEVCYICQRPYVDIHEIYGGRNRQVSMINGFCVPLCRHHHQIVETNAYADFYFKEICQTEFEKTHTREEFMKIIGKNYL